MNYFQVFLIGSALIVLTTLISLRRAHIRVEYSVSWLFMGLTLFVCALFPQLLLHVSAKIGLDPQIDFLVLAGVLVLGLLFEVSLVVSQLRDENVQLTQRLAILEYQLNQILPDHGLEAK